MLKKKNTKTKTEKLALVPFPLFLQEIILIKHLEKKDTNLF